MNMIDGLILTPLKVIDTLNGGSVLQAMNVSDKGYVGFGEAYFSTVEFGVIRGWKCHKEMTLNLVVPEGSIRFVIYDNRKESSTSGSFEDIILSEENYSRLTIPPRVWVGFQGIEKGTNLLLNIASIPHNDNEVSQMPLKELNYSWGT
jgi:dTDP-4-dehydrorhamnose 3,5-epimerase